MPGWSAGFTAWLCTALPAASSPLGQLFGVAVDGNGNVYAADYSNGLVEKISPAGILTLVVGNGFTGSSAATGTPATNAPILPAGIAVDSAGNLYIHREGRFQR